LGLKAEILELRDPEAAVQAYESITRIHGVSPEQNRQALLKLVDLAVAQNQFDNAATQLETYLKQNPLEPAADLFRMTLGELYLKEFFATTGRTNNEDVTPSGFEINQGLATNLLRFAQAQFDYVVTGLTNSSL